MRAVDLRQMPRAVIAGGTEKTMSYLGLYKREVACARFSPWADRYDDVGMHPNDWRGILVIASASLKL